MQRRIGLARHLGPFLLALALMGCDGDEASEAYSGIGARELSCEVGDRPAYYVPGGPAALAGCVRLLLSGQTMDFSVHSERIAGRPFACFNPTYPGRGSGEYIPGTCIRTARARRWYVVQASVPTQGVNGYGIVLWGIAPAGVDRTVIESRSGRTSALVITVEQRLADDAGLRKPFSIFVAELPKDSVCDGIVVEADGRKVDRVPPRGKVCRELICDRLVTALAGPGPHPAAMAFCALPEPSGDTKS